MLNAILLQAAAGGGMGSWLFILLFIAVFYFFMIRPQQQQQKRLREERKNMQKDDSVVTTGGVYGKIDGIVTRTNKKGQDEVESFIIRIKPDYNTRIQVNKDCVYRDAADAQVATR